MPKNPAATGKNIFSGEYKVPTLKIMSTNRPSSTYQPAHAKRSHRASPGTYHHLASAISLIVAQRLARSLCERCKETVEIPQKALADLSLTAELHPNPSLFRAKGCGDCRGGLRGRIGFYEVVPESQSLSRIIMEGGRTHRLRKHMRK
jgi:hypothetical protein